MNKIYKVIWSKTKNCYVVVSEYAKRNGKCSSSMNKKLIAAFLAAGTVLSVTGSAWAGSPQLAPDQSAVTNDSGLEVYLQRGSIHQYTGDNAGIGVDLTAKAANGANFVVAGLANMGTYTEGGKVLLYQVESGSTGLGQVYYGEVETIEGTYKFTVVEKNGILYTNKAKARAAGVDVDSLANQGYNVGVSKPSGGTISAQITTAAKPSSTDLNVKTQKKDTGYFQTQSITYKSSGMANATAEKTTTVETVVQTGDVVTVSVNENNAELANDDSLTISVNGDVKEYTGVHYYSVNDGGSPEDNYNNDGAEGTHAIAAGPDAKATGNSSIAIGNGAQATGDGAIAIGEGSTGQLIASGENSYVHGLSAQALGPDATAWGILTQAGQNKDDREATWEMLSEMDHAGEPGEKSEYGIGATAWGQYNKAYGTDATAFGEGNTAYGIHSTVFGTANTTYGRSSVAWGEFNEASGYDSTAFGQSNVASGYQSTAFGVGTVASGQNTATAFGNDTTASGYFASTAFGMGSKATNTASTAFGSYTTASGMYSTAFGSNTKASNSSATAFGASSTASGQAATAFGANTKASGNYATAFGVAAAKGSYDEDGNYVVTITNPLEASGYASTAFGFGVEAKGSYSTAFGYDTTAEGLASTAFGVATKTNGQGATAFGQYAEASAKGATAFGIGTADENVTASGEGATAFGSKTVAAGNYATAFGVESKAYGENSLAVLGGTAGKAAEGETAAAGKGAVAIGEGAEALQDYVYALGQNASASEENTIAIGNNAVVSGKGSVAFGNGSAVTGENSIAIGTGHNISGNNSGAFGDPTTINSDNSYSVGNNNTIGEGFENVFALGNSITTVESNSVFLGDSAAYVAKGDSTGGLEEVSEATVNNLTFDGFAGATPVGVVSVGDAGKERRIQNVAAGLVSADSTDAINGSQLYSAIDAMQFEIVAGDNVELIRNTDDNGHTVYTIHALNAIVEAGPSGNVTVEATPGEGGESNGKTTDAAGGGAGVAAEPTASDDPITPSGTNNHTTTYTVDAKDTYVVSGTVTTEATDTSDKVVTTYKYNYDDKDSFTVDSKNTYVAKAEVTQEATDDSADVKVQLTRNDGESFNLDLKDKYVAKAEVTQAATDEDDKVKVQLTRNDGQSFDLDLNNTYVAKAEVTQQATDTSDDVTIELTRNDGKSFELATKNTYLAKAELADHTLTLSRNDGTEFVVNDLATLDDGMSYAGDTGEATVKLNKTVTVTGGATELTDGNIGVVASQDGDNAKLEIKLAKEIKDVDSMAVNKTITVGGNTTIEGDQITTKTVNADTVKAGDTTINNDGVTINEGPSVTKDGIDAGNKTITNVAPGTSDTDAATVGQLKNESSDIRNEISRLDDRTRKGLAGAAALAALHPMDFNPDDKMQFSAGVGHYRGQTAAALGAFYRPDESVMFSIGGVVGNGDNMINAGITFGLDGTRNRITRSRTAMAREIQDLRSLVTQMAARMDRLEGGNLETAMFPDVPENHWAYEYVEDLQKRGALKGYPDGLFKGDRAMTRYEFAAMLDRLVRSGVTLDSKIAKEFEPELGRIYVQRISGEDNDRRKIERVRVNNEDAATRDLYGSKIVPKVPGKAAAK